MNDKVKAAFASFFVLVAIWVALVELGRPELADLLTLIKVAAGTSWTAAALFFETATQQAPVVQQPATTQVLPSQPLQ